MEQIGREYYYQTKGGTVKRSVLMNQTPAWNCFENGDWVARYSPLYESLEQMDNVNRLVHAMLFPRTYRK